MSTSESMSNKAGNLTGGTVGQETLIHQATELAGHTIEFAKGFVMKSEPVTLGDLVNETRDLTASVLEGVQSVVAGGADRAKEAAGEGQAQSKGLVQQCRGLAAAAIGTAHDIIATGAEKAEKTATDAKDTASGVAGDVSKQASKAGSKVQGKAQDTKRQAMS